MKAYNGYRSWNAWNVSLWINNDESLYRLAQDCVNKTRNSRGQTRLNLAAQRMYHRYLEGQRTPDGAKYNLSSIAAAMEGME